MLVAERFKNLKAKGRTLDSVKDAIDLGGEPLRYVENDDLEACVYVEDLGWFAVVGDRARIAGWAQSEGRVLSSVAQFEAVLAERGGLRAIRTNDDHAAFVYFKGSDRFHGEYLVIGQRAAIFKAASAVFEAQEAAE